MSAPAGQIEPIDPPIDPAGPVAAVWPWVGAIAGTIIIVALLPRQFMVNDDGGQILCLRLDTLAPFMGATLSQVLGWLYTRVSGDVPWYGLWVYGLLVPSIAVAIGLVRPLAGRLGRGIFPAAAASLLAVMLVAVARPTYSITAFFACGAALGGWLTIAAGPPRRWAIRSLSLGVLFAAGAQTRHEAMIGAIATLAPALAVAAFMVGRSHARTALLAAAIFIAPWAVGLAVNPLMPQARDPLTRQFIEYNAVRGALHGVRLYQTPTPQQLAQIDWTDDQLYLFHKFLFFDEQQYSIDALAKLRGLPVAGNPTQPNRAFIETERNIRSAGVSFWLFVAACAATFGLATGPRRTWVWLLTIAYANYVLLLAWTLTVYVRLPYRAAMPMFVVATIGVWVTATLVRRREPPTHKAGRFAFVITGVLVAACLIGLAFEWFTVVQPLTPIRHTPIYEALRRDRDRIGYRFLVVYDSAAHDFDRNGNPYGIDPLRADPFPREITPIGWLTFSPVFYDRLRPLGVERGAQVLQAMLDQPDAYIVARRETEVLFQFLIDRRFDHPVRLEPVHELDGPDRVTLFRLVRGDPAPVTP